MEYLLLSCCNNCYKIAPQCYLLRALPVLFYQALKQSTDHLYRTPEYTWLTPQSSIKTVAIFHDAPTDTVHYDTSDERQNGCGHLITVDLAI
jgi:hypothetical protein